jgi:hypothetical protein
MEDYQAAFLQRAADVTTLDENGRCIAAIHFGGVTVECLLQHILFTSLPQGAKKYRKQVPIILGILSQILDRVIRKH